MLTRARSKLTYSNVVSSLCLVAVLGGGTAIAATAAKNSVTSKSVKNESIQGKDVQNDSLTGDDVNESTLRGVQGAQGPQGPQGPEGPQGPAGPAEGPAGGDLSGNYPNPSIAAGAVGGDEVAANSLGGGDIDESSLGAVPTANALTLTSFDAFNTAAGQADTNGHDDIAGLDELNATCATADQARITISPTGNDYKVGGTFARNNGAVENPIFNGDVDAGDSIQMLNLTTTQFGTGSFTISSDNVGFGLDRTITVNYMAQLDTVADTCEISGTVIERIHA